MSGPPGNAPADRRRRICLCTDSLEPSGVGEHMLALAGELAASWDVAFALRSLPSVAPLADRAARAGFAVQPYLAEDEPAFGFWLARQGFDILHVHAGIGWEGHGLARLGRAHGVAVVIRTEHLPYLITDAGQADAYRAGIERVDRVICVSRAAIPTYRAAGVPATKLACVRNGIAPRPASRGRAETRRGLGITPEAPVLLMVARFTPQKGHDTLLAALPALRAAHPATRVLLVGAGPGEATARAAAATAQVADMVAFLGTRDDVPDLLAAADLLVLPSRFEGLPLVVLEAMAAGLPVVASRVGGTDEAVADGTTGILVPADDPAALARAVVATLGAPPGRLADAARSRFAAHFTAARMAADTEQIYAAATAATTTGPRAGPAFRTRTMMERVRIGFIGAGGIAQRHLGILRQFPDVDIVALADTSAGRAAESAGDTGARAFDSHRAMLDAGGLDAVFICVPPFAHGAPEHDAIAHGLPFLVEKPVAIDLATAEAIAAAAAQAGLVTAVGYHWRYLDTVDEARALLAGNPAHLVSGYWLDSTPPPPWWWRHDRSGGQMVEQTTHILDLARLLVGDVEQVFGLASHRTRGDFPGLDVATASTASLRFAGGAIGNVGATCLLRWGHRVGLHLFADGLAIELHEHEIMVDVGRGRPVRRAEGDPVWRQDRDFIDAVLGRDNQVRCPYAEAVKTQRLAVAIAQSAQTGRPVDLAGRLAHA